MTYADTLEEQLVELRLQVDDLRRDGVSVDEAILMLEHRIEKLERKLNHKVNHKGAGA